MRTYRPVSRGACAALVLALIVTALDAGAPTGAGAATTATAWHASVGASGANGMATVQADAVGTGSIFLQLLRLPASTTHTVALHKGICGSVGAVLVKLPSIRTSSSGGGIRTTRLTKAQTRAVTAALKGTTRLAIRIGTGAGATCGAFAPVVAQVGFLTRQGSDLLLGGAPFHELSFNKFDLLAQFSPVLGGDWGDRGPGIVAAAEEALKTLGSRGFRVVRVAVSPYSASGFEAAFFDADPARQAQKRREFFAGFDQMLDACDRHGIRIVASLLWQVETLGKLGGQPLRATMIDPDSLGRRRVAEFVSAVVARYRDRPTIAMWEVGNEYNLVADIQWPQFDVTSDQVAAFVHDLATLVRSIDRNHLITTGDSTPRPSAMHLLQAVRAGKEVDWTPDSAEEQIAYLRLMNADPIDVISIHYYDDGMITLGGRLGSPENLRFYARAAAEIGKPLFIGEMGLDADVESYTTPAALALLRATLPVLVELKLPLTLYWTFNDDREGRADTALRYGRTDEALRLIEAASRDVRR
jgi:hypothetical protein